MDDVEPVHAQLMSCEEKNYTKDLLTDYTILCTEYMYMHISGSYLKGMHLQFNSILCIAIDLVFLLYNITKWSLRKDNHMYS